jgi:tRNA (guanine26-N2/guanine27-N2)-dimethyltransferase
MAAKIAIPEGFTIHTENTTHVLLQSSKDAFLNPVQEFNRDLSVACISVWSELLSSEKVAKSIARSQRGSGESPHKRVKRELT